MSETEEKVVKMCAEKDNKKNVVQKVLNKAENYISPSEKKGAKKTGGGGGGGGGGIKKKGETKRKFRAAFLKSKVWPANTTINIGFLSLNSYEKIPRTSTAKLKKSVDRNGVLLKMDPLQEEVEDMSVRDAIIYTVLKRYNDIIYPEYKPASVKIDPDYKPNPLINIKFNFFDPTDPSRKTLFNPNLADIKIDFDPIGGAWSYIGTDTLEEDKGKPTMNFGWFDVPTVLHEFCHALGMVHEHSNPNGKPINWAVCHVSRWASDSQGWDAETIKENIVEKYKVDQINGSEFDPRSIMLYFYPGNVLCKEDADKTAPDITLGDVEKCFEGCKKVKRGDTFDIIACNTELDKCEMPGKGTTQNLRFSPWDVLYLNNVYPSETSMTSEQITVKFFNDNYGEQITSDDLTKQLQLSKEREAKSEGYEDDEEYDEDREKFENELIQEMYEELTEETNKKLMERDERLKEYYENATTSIPWFVWVIIAIFIAIFIGFVVYKIVNKIDPTIWSDLINAFSQ
jgi:hypothetical protein